MTRRSPPPTLPPRSLLVAPARAGALGVALVAALAGALSGCGGDASGPSVTMPTPETHARYFPIAAGDAHALSAGPPRIDCNDCHWDKLGARASDSFLTFTCTGCHVPAPSMLHDDSDGALSAFHLTSAAVVAFTARTGQPYEKQDAACRACHPQGIRDAVDHALHFPLPHRDAAGLNVARCADCHVNRAVSYLKMGCATCHPHEQLSAANAPAHAKVLDFVPLAATATPAEKEAASELCVRCHGDGVVPVTVANHAARAKGFPIGGGSAHSKAYLPAPAGPPQYCLGCHPARRADPGKKLAADFKVTGCVGCHVTIGASNLDHSSRPALEAFHLTRTAAPKALNFAATVDAATAAAGGDPGLGLSAACLQCHPQGIGPHPYYLIPHQNAAKTVVASCEQCHVNPARKADLGCAACHAAVSPVGTKHARVPDVAAADTSVAASAQCARCHEYDAIPVRVATGHTKFPIAAGKHSGAAGGACLKCHPAMKGEPTPWAADWKQTGCTGCHVAVGSGRAQHDDQGLTAGQVSLATLHAGATDYAAKVAALGLSAACRACHPTGLAGPPANHGEYFDLSATSRHVYPGARIKACLDCHTSSNRLDPAAFRCAACHAADAVPLATGHALVPDFGKDPQNPVKCLACHADGRLPATAAKVTLTVKGHALASGGFIIDAGSHSGTAGNSCLTCHPVNRAPTAAAPHWDYARDWKQYGCNGCHVAVGGGRAWHDNQGAVAPMVALSAIHSDPAAFNAAVASKGLSAACLSCHPGGAGGAPPNHPTLFPIGIGSKHAAIACAQCHTNPANRKDLTAFACASCHAALPATATRKAWSAAHTVTGYAITSYLTATTAEGTTTTVQVSMTDSRTCLRCHADSQVNRISTHPLGDSGFGESRHRPAGCFTCHWRMRTDKPWGALFSSASGAAGPPPSSCYVCHRTGSG